MDVVILSWFVSMREVGVYSAALTIVYGVDLIYASLATTLLPRVSSLRTRQELGSYLRRSMLVSFGCAIAAVPIFVGAELIIEIAFGEEFAVAAEHLRVADAPHRRALPSIPAPLRACARG